MDIQQQLKDTINKSGFPLQIAIERTVNGASQKHGWKVLFREHAWANSATGADGFIDLVLIDQHRTSSIVIECKRILDGKWIFLKPADKNNNEATTKTLIASSTANSEKFDWIDLTGYPVTSEASVCIFYGSGNNSRNLLENFAGELIQATESLAQEEAKYLKNSSPNFKLYVSLIVTTAELNICDIYPEQITIKDGQLDNANFRIVPYLRFRKQLSNLALADTANIEDYYDRVARAKESTVFIVNSEYLLRFLEEFRINDRNWNIIQQEIKSR